ncbi:hypothetical protein SZN_10333 [Streptomyces zinciresistens K42]|uniref:Integral membrane protein n=1 Tax=Streptomyces zinciresistens K42 TaxID=700597 RepID=G2G996_9ACTN|nr:hypothetical protein [Streptomyces zinciresistens]EGX59930.1 hypothetical protein SZN_10333 [Streptomyces zinciresistens K42]
MDISGTQLRAVRAALFTSLVVTLSSASHVLLSRAPLPLNTVAVLAAVVFAVAYALAGRERTFGRIAALLIPLELAADTILTTGQHMCYGPAGGPVAGPLASVGWDVLCGDGTEVGTPLAQVSGDPGRVAALLAESTPATAWLLLAAHVCVGLVAAAWLRRGERALVQVLRALGASTFRPLRIAQAAGTARATERPGRGPLPQRRTASAPNLLLAYSLGRRGPPCSPALTCG